MNSALTSEIVRVGNKLLARMMLPKHIDLDNIDINFHCSWDRLMLVVEYVESLKSPVYISSNNCTIYEKTGKDHGFMIDIYGHCKFDATYMALVAYAQRQFPPRILKNKEGEQ